jgi:putative DNA methylase
MSIEQRQGVDGSVVGATIDHHFDTDLANALARQESYNKHLYRPNSYLHKWWARRCGSTFRLILKGLVNDPSHRDFYNAGGLTGKIILDPMLGGGTTLHEAIRLGANVVGADIDPIPLLQARATLADVPLPLLESAFAQFYSRLREEMASLYQTACPYCARTVELSYMLYGLRRFCRCQEVIFVDSLVLRHHRDGSVVQLISETHDIQADGRLIARSSHQNPPRLLARNTTSHCEQCGSQFHENLTVPYYQRYSPVAAAGKCPEHGRFFAPPTPQDLDAMADAEEMRGTLPFDPGEFEILCGPKSRSLIDRQVASYLDLFSSRQLLFLHKCIHHLAPLTPPLRLNLSLLVSTSLEFNSMLCGYKGSHKNRPGTIRHTFARHAYSFPYTALENNPVYPSRSSGSLQNLFRSRIVRGRKWSLNPIERQVQDDKITKVVIQGETDIGTEFRQFADLQEGSQRFLLIQGSSVSLNLPDNSVDYVVTDPPYFDSVQYGDLAAFFRVWLRRLLPEEASWDYALTESAVDQQANGDGQYFSVLSGIFQECHRVLKGSGRLVFTFHHWNPKGWASLTLALKRAGFILVNRYVVHAENRVSVHIANQNALLHDVILVLAPADSPVRTTWQRLLTINNQDSQAFCQECGTMVGWMLNNPQSAAEIHAIWHTLLS